MSSSRLIILPETALPLFFGDVPKDYLSVLADHARRNGGDILIGVPEKQPNGEYFNSVVSLGTSASQTYRKSHLVPFRSEERRVGKECRVRWAPVDLKE